MRCEQLLGIAAEIPEGGYQGDYLIPIAQTYVNEYGRDSLNKDLTFFSLYAEKQLLKQIKQTLTDYGITYDQWFSEQSLHASGIIEEVMEEFKSKDLIYEKEGAWWFRAELFGDEKDRVIKKSDGAYTYIAADIAYHKNKFDRQYDYLIDILGQDHHGYVKRLQGTMAALGYPAHHLHVILYQLVSITNQGAAVRMSKRKGTFTELADVIDEVGIDVARFFYLNRKADAHLDFDLAVALKKSDENPVYYIHYAYVRTKSLLNKASEHAVFDAFIKELIANNMNSAANALDKLGVAEHEMIKKIMSLETILHTIGKNYQTHLLSYFTLELAKQFHSYYTSNKIIDPTNEETSYARLFIVMLTQRTLDTCLDLLGLSKPEKM